ncbi:EamA family transporter RarD [Cognatishimia sp.]|uniref:EamA family transporter RarD n=1 Tax=Cognatishimia sp. TaxID=2211648 RepID=UPI003518CCC5
MTNTATNKDTPEGLAFAVSAYLMWGFLPLYLQLISHIPAVEVVAHRVIWSVPVAGLLLVLLKRTDALREALRSPKTLALAALTAGLISVNWAIYVYAIATDQTADAALGYYINPLFSVLLGAILLRERPTRAQMVAIALAGLAVVILFITASRPPWIPLGLMISWGFYAYFKKSLPIGPNQGFLLEVLILSIPAVPYVLFLSATGQGHLTDSVGNFWLLLGCGVVTAVPLIVYANGAKLLRLSTMAILQYIAPSMIFIIAIFLFGETIDTGRMIAFPLIWMALIIYTTSMIREMRKG